MGIITLGPEGTLSHQATLKLFPQKKIFFASSISHIFFQLANPQFSEGIIPFENTQGEFLEESIINLMKYDFSLTRKITLPISYVLVGKEEKMSVLYTDLIALRHSRALIKKKCPQVKIIETLNSAFSAIQYRAHPKNSVALTSTFSQQHFNLPILAENQGEEMFATFLGIGKEVKCKKNKRYGSSFLLFSEKSMVTTRQIISFCHEKKVPLIKLKDLILQEGKTPLYFVEVEGLLESPNVHRFFAALNERFLVKFLGSYPL